MIQMRDICVSFRSERQEKIFGVSRTQVLFDVSLSITGKLPWNPR